MAAPTGFVGWLLLLWSLSARSSLAGCLSLSPRRAEESARQRIFVISLHLGLDSRVTTNADRRARLLSTDPEISSLSAGQAAESPGMPMSLVAGQLQGVLCPERDGLSETVLLDRTWGSPRLSSLPVYLDHAQQTDRNPRAETPLSRALMT